MKKSNDTLCKGCNESPATAEHPCPAQEDDSRTCNCCDDCVQACSDLEVEELASWATKTATS